MSMEFGFIFGPATKDEGDIDDLINDDDPRPGFINIQPINLPDPSAGNRMAAWLGINLTALYNLNAATNNGFSAFVGTGNQRYIRLASRLPELVGLKDSLPQVTDQRLQEFLRVFIENCEHALDVGKNQALLIIY